MTPTILNKDRRFEPAAGFVGELMGEWRRLRA